MTKYILFIKRFKRPLVIILILLNILAILGVTRLSISSNFDIFVPVVSENRDLLDDMNQQFPSADQIIYLVPLDSTLNEENFLSLQSFQTFLEDNKQIDRVQGPGPEIIQLGINTLDLRTIDSSTLMQVEQYYEQLGSMSPIVTKDNQSYGVFTLFINSDFSVDDVHLIEGKLDSLNLAHYATGDSYMQMLVFEYIKAILRFMPPLALLLVLFVFSLQLQSLKATLLAILPAAMGALWTMGIIGWTGQDVSIVTVLSPVFTIVIGSADGLHFVTHVQDEEDLGHTQVSGLANTLKIVGKPMIITTITSMVGFLTLLTMNTSAIHDLAIFASVGIMFAGFITWYVLPLILVGKTRLHRRASLKPMTFSFLKKLWGLPSIIIILVVILSFVIGVSHVSNEFNMLMVYKESTDIYKSTMKIQEVNDGSIPLYLFTEVNGNPLSATNKETFDALSAKLTSSEAVSKVISPYTMIETMIPLIIPNQSGYPEDGKIIEQLSTMIRVDSTNPLNNLVNLDQNSVRLIVFPKDLSNDTLNTIKSISSSFESSPENVDDYNFHVTGVQFLMSDLNNSMVRNQIFSTGLALLIVFLLLFMSLRKILPTLISIVPIILTTGFLFGFLGFTGISLNILTTTMFSITIGVGIDYAIHFTSVFTHLRHEGQSSNDAVENTFKYTARPIIANALGLSLGLSALFISPLQLHNNVATLMWATMIVSVLFSLTFLPTALKKFG